MRLSQIWLSLRFLFFFSAFLALGFLSDDLYEDRSVLVCLRHGKVQALKLQNISLRGDPLKLLGDPAAERNAVRFGFDPVKLAEFLEIDRAIHDVCIIADLAEGLHDLVVLVPDVTDKLLQNILHRYDAERSAVFIDNDRNVCLLCLKLLEDRNDLFRFVNKDRMCHNVLDLTVRYTTADVKVAQMEHADDIVDAFLVNEKARELTLGEDLCDLTLFRIDRNRLEIDTVRQDLLGAAIGKLDRVLEKIALLSLIEPSCLTSSTNIRSSSCDILSSR